MRATIAGCAGVLLVLAGSMPAAAQQDDGDRIRAIVTEGRVRPIVRRIEAIDGSQRVEETPEMKTVTLSADVFFELEQATLTPAALTTLDAFAAEIAAEATGPITIVGHTDSLGTDEYNQGLSEARAESVQAHLAAVLGPSFTLEATGRGETEPVAPNQLEDRSDNPQGRARNRRVEFSYPKIG